jgi:nitrogen fixation/metabolism regulation signal transduction histidine kinase
MGKTAPKDLLSRHKGLLAPTGPQTRFILFLIFVLVAYTFLLRIFQKLAAIVELPVFLPITLLALLVFIGLAGTLYSHRFVGPVVRIRSTLERIAAGDCHVTLRLRESDDPMMKDLAKTIGKLCEHGRHTHQAVQITSDEFFRALALLEEQVRAGASAADLKKQLEILHEKKAALELAVKSMDA